MNQNNFLITLKRLGFSKNGNIFDKKIKNFALQVDIKKQN